MSKINAVRLINLNYNNNAIKISDETFHLNGESTLLSLRNGGGKSVLVQMMMAPFVHMRYRDTKERSFESYFTTAKPTFLLVEWMLDQNAGYVLTGLMVRKRQDFSDEERERKDELEIVSIISEYKERCMHDIHHLPVVEKTKKEMVLKNFGACRQLFEAYKKDNSMRFFHYDMNNSAQSRQYFDKLKEYQIDYKEWESIIKKVNIKESGLSDLFSDCKDEKGLVEKWFLDAVENKLNKDQNRMKEFQTIVEHYVGQYLENRSKIKRYDTICRFGEEADKIREEAMMYDKSSKLVGEHENLIACFISELVRLLGLERQEKEEIQTEMEHIRQKISNLMYEKLSEEFYQMKAEEEYRSSNLDLLDMERESLSAEKERISHGLHLLDCARQQAIVDEDSLALSEARQSLFVSRQKEVDLEPERKRLGNILKKHYRKACDIWKEKQQINEAEEKRVNLDIAAGKERLAELDSDLFDATVKASELKIKIETFNQTEQMFCHKYGQNFSRNILGEYEPAALDIWRDSQTKKLEQQMRERTSGKKRLEAAAEEKKGLIRAAEDFRQKCLAAELNKKDESLTRDLYEKELGERKTILRYFDLDEKDLFSTDKILSLADRKLQEMERIRRTLEKEEDLLQKEIMGLTDGKVLELPPVFVEMLERIGLQPIYGMEWLNKNGYTKKQNSKLVSNHPFLPYALIFSRQELTRLMDSLDKEEFGEAFTSFPIPIILREQLDQDITNKERLVIELQGVNFYVSFNKNLLDTNKLEIMIQEKERQREKLSESIARKKEELDDYVAKREKIKNQQVTKERYDENQKLLAAAEKEIAAFTDAIREKDESLTALEKELDDLRSHIMRLEKSVETAQLCLDEFQEYCGAYDIYLKRRKELVRQQKTVERLAEQKRLLKDSMDKLRNEHKSLEYSGRDISAMFKEMQGKYAVYAEYEEEEMRSETEMSAEEMEARYVAITAQFSMERQELEKRMEQCRKRLEQSKEQLAYLADKYKLSEDVWIGIIYQRKEEQHQEIVLEDLNLKIQRKESLWNEEDKALAVIRQQMKSQKKKILLDCKKEEPLPKDQTGSRDYEAEMKILSVQENDAKIREADSCERIYGYEGNLTALAEYSDLVISEPLEWKQNFAKLKRKELDTFKGERIRDYRISMDKKQACRNQLSQLLNKILRMELFQDDFYHKPLEALTELLEDAAQVLAQLDITVQSYRTLMEKLEVDISFVEKEKAKIVELLEDYVCEVHENLDKIDRNSTITIRERPVKMLKIQLPSWEENEALYQVRLSDFMDEVTKRGVEIFEKNENAADYFAARVTTKNLYDTVVGFGNVQIRLYKIEEQREYPITWTDVAKNSGGEGFLSAFVILSCLLHYMRKDESDIFADRNEGKVLVMDNPFAQTNAAHLLKPLMDMAKKANTQLICLSGLGGESIYGRFDNIYVLNLIAASLRSGMQYVRSDHIKGAEAETMISSRIEVAEQQEFVLF